MSEQNPYGKNGVNPYDQTQTGYGYPPPGYGYPQQDPQGYPQQGYPQQPPGAAPGGPGWQHSGPAAPMQGAAGTLLTIGDIAVTGDSVVTPAGPLPLRGAVWTVSDMSRTEERMPAYAIVLAVIFFFACLLGLLFLLIKERKTTGYIQVTVNSGGRYHATMIPARGPNDVFAVTQQVNYARSLSA